mgnify:CR=1 FL=1
MFSGIYIKCLICKKKLYCEPWEQKKGKKYCSQKCMGLSKRGRTINLGSNNGQWKGHRVGYEALHAWIKKRLNKPQVCWDCNKPKKLDLANISQKYLRELSDWEWLCRSCHMIKDGRMDIIHRKGRKCSPETILKMRKNTKKQKRNKKGQFFLAATE